MIIYFCTIIFLFLTTCICGCNVFFHFVFVFSDVERRNKVKQIYSWGANQAHEINKMAKKKNK